MKRKAVNPWEWSLKFGYNQAEVVDGATRQVICAEHYILFKWPKQILISKFVYSLNVLERK